MSLLKGWTDFLRQVRQGLSQPSQTGKRLVDRIGPQREIILVVDRSPSMLTEDMKPTNRYCCALQATAQFNDQCAAAVPETLLSLCLFSGNATIAIPPCLAGETFAQRLKALHVRGSSNYTNFIAALKTARSAFIHRAR